MLTDRTRKEPFFALCGLNCCLCPRFNTDGKSKCPGCGGPDFPEKHPTCPVMTCNKKHDAVEFCFQCCDYPCGRYRNPPVGDSFISYKNVAMNLDKAKRNMTEYLEELSLRKKCLDTLLNNFNDGRKKSFYCLAANDLPPEALTEIMAEIESLEKADGMTLKERSRTAAEIISAKAAAWEITLELRR